MKKYKLLESMSIDGVFYLADNIYGLSAEIVAKIPPDLLEEVVEPTKTTKWSIPNYIFSHPDSVARQSRNIGV